jgi:hypothetical protein
MKIQNAHEGVTFFESRIKQVSCLSSCYKENGKQILLGG